MAIAARATSELLAGRYRVLERIAAGGMGVVYKAFDLELQRTVALKFVSPQHTADAAFRERLLREARAASALEHENIAAIHGIGETEDGQLFIDMGFYEGEDLCARLRRAPLTLQESLDIVSQVARGLAHAHSHNVIHRDIKPANIILTSEGVAKIVDFGLARLLTPDASTVSIDFAGTLAYMSPEQVTGRSVDARTDIWSLGAVFYELLAKRQPFCAGSTASILNAILNSDPSDMELLLPEQRAVICRAMQKNPAMRYQSAQEFFADIELLRGNHSPEIGVGAWSRFKAHFRNPAAILRWAATVALVLGIALFNPTSVTDVPHEKHAANRSAGEIYQQGMTLLERYDKQENLNAAIQKFEQTVSIDPNFALAYAALGEAYVDKYRLDQNPDWLEQARAYCEKAVQINDQLPDVRVKIGRIHNLAGKHDLALQEIQRAMKLGPPNAPALLALADTYADLKRNTEAEKSYVRAIALRPNNWDGYQRHAYFYMRTGRFADAEKQYREAIRLAPDNAKVHSNLAAVLMRLGRLNEAEKEMKETLRLAPTYTAYYNLAFYYYTQNRYAEAAAMAELAVTLNKDDYNIWQMLGLCYEWTAKPEEAKAAYQKELLALQKAEPLKAEDAIAQVELGLLLSKVQRNDEAISHIQTALALEPRNPDVLLLAGEAYENLGDRGRAISYVEQGIRNGATIKRLRGNPDLQAFLKDPAVQKRLSRLSGPTK